MFKKPDPIASLPPQPVKPGSVVHTDSPGAVVPTPQMAIRNPIHMALEMAVQFIHMIRFNAEMKQVPVLGDKMIADTDWILMVADGMNRKYEPEAPRYDKDFSEIFGLPFTIGYEDGQMVAHWHQESFATMIKHNPHPIGAVACQLYSRLSRFRDSRKAMNEMQSFLRVFTNDYMQMRMMLQDIGLLSGEKLLFAQRMEDLALEMMNKLEVK